MTRSKDTTRRGFLSTTAVLAASAAVTIPAGAIEADPIFAVIEAHRHADAACVSVDGNIPDDLADRCNDAWHLVMQTRATTPAGLAALTTWTREQAAVLAQSGSGLLSDDFLTIAATIDDSARGMSGLKPWSPPAVAARVATSDPIFAAIEAHKAAMAAFRDCLSAHSKLESLLPRDKRQSNVDAHGESIVETDDPRWIENERDVMRLSAAETDAACTLICSEAQPATMAGVMALLQYAISHDTDGEMWPERLCIDDDGELRSQSWHRFLIEMLVDVLPGLAVQS